MGQGMDDKVKDPTRLRQLGTGSVCHAARRAPLGCLCIFGNQRVVEKEDPM